MSDMKFIIVGRNIEVTQGLKSAVEEKIGKLEKYFTPDTEVRVTLSVEKDRQKIEVTIPVKGSIIRSEQVSNDMYVSIDLVEEIIERQLKSIKPNWWTSIRRQHPSAKCLQKMTIWRTRKSKLSARSALTLNPCTLRMHVCRWSFWGIAFTCSTMRRQTRSMWCTSVRAILTD